MLKGLVNSYSFKYSVIYTLLLGFCLLLGVGIVYLEFSEILNDNIEETIYEELNNQASSEQILPPVRDNTIVVVLNNKSFPLFDDKKPNRFFYVGNKLAKHHKQDSLNSGMKAIFINKSRQKILVAVSTHRNQLISSAVKVIIYIFMVFILLMLLFSYLFNNQLSRRINYISVAAKDIMKGQLNKRITVPKNRKDRFTKISKTLNEMLDKIEILMNDVNQVTNNIAHDLKSPINRIKSRMEVTQLKERTIEEYEELIDKSIVDLDEVIDIFDSLLLIANTNSSLASEKFKFNKFSLSNLLIGVAELYELSAENKQQILTKDIPSDINIKGHKKLFAQAICNLVGNSIKYTQSGGKIHISLAIKGEFIIMKVFDDGPGIPNDRKDEMFKRFTRIDKSRYLSGSGLGLSLVKSILKIHKATIKLEDNNPGLIARISLIKN